jgi:hypothetical protein
VERVPELPVSGKPHGVWHPQMGRGVAPFGVQFGQSRIAAAFAD